MTPDTLPALLTQWGVDASALGPVETLPFPEPLVDEARSTRVLSSERAPSLEEYLQPPLAVRSDVLDDIGLTASIAVEPRLLTLSRKRGIRFGLSATTDVDWEPGEALVRVPLDPSLSLVVENVEGGPLAVANVDSGGIHLRAVFAWPAPPIDVWLASAGAAERELLSARHGTNTRWHETIVAGRVARLSRGFDPRARAAAIRDGRDIGAFGRARIWLRELTTAQRALIEHLAVIGAGQLEERLDALLERLRPEDATLADSWRRLCYERDDLEGIRVLLREAYRGEALAAGLQAADKTGQILRFSWPEALDVHDERLRRVTEGEPAAWWGSTRYRLPVSVIV